MILFRSDDPLSVARPYVVSRRVGVCVAGGWHDPSRGQLRLFVAGEADFCRLRVKACPEIFGAVQVGPGVIWRRQLDLGERVVD